MTLALDYGRARTGIAILEGGIPLPAEPVLGDRRAVLERVRSMLAGDGTDVVVLGLPLASGQRPTEMSMEVEALAEAIRGLGAVVALVEERGSSAEARSMPVKHRRRTGRTDSLAALVILERYMAGS